MTESTMTDQPSPHASHTTTEAGELLDSDGSHCVRCGCTQCVEFESDECSEARERFTNVLRWHFLRVAEEGRLDSIYISLGIENALLGLDEAVRLALESQQ